jgi:NAD(P)H-hydrate epimerase
MRAGAGLVTLATPANVHPIVAAKLTEATYLPIPESSSGIVVDEAVNMLVQQLKIYNTLLIGCGLGQNQETAEFVKAILTQKGLPPTVIDADALNILSGLNDWHKQIPDNVVITPHPGELSRLTGLKIEDIQADRLNIALKYAGEWNKTVVLKGAYAIIAGPDGRCGISPFANPGLATAGTGDVLAGTIAGLAAQGLPLFEAACLGVYLHGEAGEMIRNMLGDTGMIASDLLQALPVVIKELKRNR